MKLSEKIAHYLRNYVPGALYDIFLRLLENFLPTVDREKA